MDEVLHGLVSVPDSYIPNAHPLYTPQLALYPFDPTAGAEMLENVGWKDLDNDPATPRTAVNIAGVPAGAELVLNYTTTTSLQRRQASEILVNSMAQCGIGMEVNYLDPETFYAAAPDGDLLGRNFDLAQFALGTEGMLPQCGWFMSDAVPTTANRSSGTGLTNGS